MGSDCHAVTHYKGYNYNDDYFLKSSIFWMSVMYSLISLLVIAIGSFKIVKAQCYSSSGKLCTDFIIITKTHIIIIFHQISLSISLDIIINCFKRVIISV